ncbi:hypothetical protein SUGI_0346330 [Cryptomeria japonica]|nr:hypothetical protein SUGI_0346330 [Cryptomeria japonica]
MEGLYLTCKIRPYFPIRLVETGATGEVGAPGAETGTTIEKLILKHPLIQNLQIQMTVLDAIAQGSNKNVVMDATNSGMGDPPILNALIDMLKNGQGQQITMMVHEAISKVTPSSVNLVGMKDPVVLSNTSTVMIEDIIRITPTNTNVPDLGSVRILPPTIGQVSLRSLIDSQSRILRELLESAGPTSDEQVHQFQKEASEEDLKYALLHGSQGLQQNLVDRGEILVSGLESKEAQQSNSLGSEHEEEVEDHDELFVPHNDSIFIPETRQETIL